VLSCPTAYCHTQGDINNDIMKIKTILYAHLLQEEVPQALQEDVRCRAAIICVLNTHVSCLEQSIRALASSALTC
jgi:hypothetical protein